ncbi:hypothetical protein AAK967_00895 [Atopobiaceae bacterium 24-176]
MLYPYMVLGDDIQVCHSELIEDGDTKKVLVHFERPTEDGFDSARCELPSYTWTPWEGSFSQAELAEFEEFLQANAHLIYEFAQSGGLKIA